jgi:hypothetical protein
VDVRCGCEINCKTLKHNDIRLKWAETDSIALASSVFVRYLWSGPECSLPPHPPSAISRATAADRFPRTATTSAPRADRDAGRHPVLRPAGEGRAQRAGSHGHGIQVDQSVRGMCLWLRVLLRSLCTPLCGRAEDRGGLRRGQAHGCPWLAFERRICQKERCWFCAQRFAGKDQRPKTKGLELPNHDSNSRF